MIWISTAATSWMEHLSRQRDRKSSKRCCRLHPARTPNLKSWATASLNSSHGKSARSCSPHVARLSLPLVAPALARAPFPEVPPLFLHEARKHHHVHLGGAIHQAGRARGAIDPLRD